MDSKQAVKDILVAISSVKSQARKALEAGDNVAYTQLMANLFNLEVCLVGSTERLMEDLDKVA